MGKTIAMVMVMGWLFLVLGVLGFISNPLIGENGLFHADLNHNIVHLLSGIIILWVVYKSSMKIRMIMKVFGVVYLLVALLGLFMSDGGSILGLVEVNGAVNWLHLIFAVVMLWAGFMSKGNMPMSMNSGSMNNTGGMNSNMNSGMGGGMGNM